jgi:hypothetical protein
MGQMKNRSALLFLLSALLCLFSRDLNAASPEIEAARRLLDTWHADHPEREDRKLHVIVWRSRDRGFAPDYKGRLRRIMEHIRDFYASEMDRHGFGPRTIDLDYNAAHELVIHEVTGSGNHADYGKPDGRRIREECLPVLKAAGIDASRETILIFTNLVEWDGEALTFQHKSPYYAGGNHQSGTAYQLDSAELDTTNLILTEPLISDGEYGRISLGKHNSIFIGGIAHEMGHALGLPHCRARPGESPEGRTALMGSGNRTYFEELRGEGQGTFLTFAHALRLASHPQFSGSVKGLSLPVKARLRDRVIDPGADQRQFEFRARIESPIPAYAVIGYLDPEGKGDYDSLTVTAIPEAAGSFTLHCRSDSLSPGKGDLRVVTCLVNGATSSESFPYTVRADGTVDLETARFTLAAAPFLDAVEAKNYPEAESLLATWPQNSRESRLARAILTGRRGDPRNTLSAAAVPLAEREIALTRLSPAEEKVGWAQPAYDHVPRRDALLLVGDRLFETGIYAHADSVHRYDLATGDWKRLSGTGGLAPGGGSVVFVILADGKEVYRSPLVKTGELAPFELNIEDVSRLELRTEDGGDGETGDWALWLEPMLSR